MFQGQSLKLGPSPDSACMRAAFALASSKAVIQRWRSTSQLAFRWYVCAPPFEMTKLQASSTVMDAVARFMVPRHVWPISAWVLTVKSFILSKNWKYTSLWHDQWFNGSYCSFSNVFIKTPRALFSPGKCTCSTRAAHCSGQTTSADIPWCNSSTWTPILCTCHQLEWEWGSWTLTSQPSKPSKPTSLTFKNLNQPIQMQLLDFHKKKSL